MLLSGERSRWSGPQGGGGEKWTGRRNDSEAELLPLTVGGDGECRKEKNQAWPGV